MCHPFSYPRLAHKTQGYEYCPMLLQPKQSECAFLAVWSGKRNLWPAGHKKPLDATLHNEELNDLYSSPNIRVIKSRSMRCVGHVACMGERRGAYVVSMGKPEGQKPLGRPRLRWEDNIMMDLQEVGCGDMDWINLAHDKDRCQALMNAVINLWIP